MTSPEHTVVFGLHPSRQFTRTAPAAIKSLIFERDMRNPAEATASRRMDASMLVNSSLLGGGRRSLDSGSTKHFTGTERTDFSADDKNVAISGAHRIAAPRSPCT